jgi:two-component system, OmpR family, KDP operon response regulator KdpE
MRRYPSEIELEASTPAPEAPKPSILVVEDDAAFIRVLQTALGADGYRVMDAVTGQNALAEVRTRNPDIVLLDLGLPDVDGLSLVAEIRKHTTAPIIVVSGRDREDNKVTALDAGANDYVTKPFSVSELRARIRVGLRAQSHVGDGSATSVTFGEYTLDLPGRRLMKGARQVKLSATELKLLATLARHANRVVTTQTLLRETWGSAYQTRAGYVRVYMHALRAKLEKDPTRPRYLLNELRLGYKLQTTPP